jgi:hypothetical protein
MPHGMLFLIQTVDPGCLVVNPVLHSMHGSWPDDENDPTGHKFVDTGVLVVLHVHDPSFWAVVPTGQAGHESRLETLRRFQKINTMIPTMTTHLIIVFFLYTGVSCCCIIIM